MDRRIADLRELVQIEGYGLAVRREPANLVALAPQTADVAYLSTGHGLFERFYSGEQTTSSAGLGLYVARMLVEAHGGRIWASSTPGAGSTFTVALPLTDPA